MYTVHILLSLEFFSKQWLNAMQSCVGVGGISVYLVNFGVYWIPNIIGGLNRDTEIPILFGFTWYDLQL